MGITIDVYRELYFKLFGAIANAVEALEDNEPMAAKKLQIAIMREAEERVISEEETR